MTNSRLIQAISVALLLSAPACTSEFASMGNEYGAGAAGAPTAGAPSGKCQYGGKTYTVGQSFKSLDGCNSCMCSDNGEVGCTLMACVGTGGATGTGGAASGACSYNGASYQVGQSFKASDGCNTCYCDQNGMVGCTEMACIGAGGANGTGGAGGGTCVYGGKSYSVGQSFKATDGCNGCFCGEDGTVACTLIGCVGAGGANGVGGATGGTCAYNGKSYSVGQSFKSTDGCNTCSCGNEGTVACTDMQCVGAGGATGVGGASGGTCLYNGASYPVGQSFKSSDGCNTCSCGKDGRVACTLMACIAAGGTTGAGGASANVGGSTSCPGYPAIMPVCSSGDPVMQYDTNTCETGYVCPSEACTCTDAKIRAPNVECADGSIGGPVCAVDSSTRTCSWKMRSCPATGAGGATGAAGAAGASGVSCVYKQVTYAPGESFKDDCNTCTCSATGVVGCTKMACPAAAGGGASVSA